MKDKIKIIDNAVLKTKHKEYDKLLADHLEKEGNKKKRRYCSTFCIILQKRRNANSRR